jgi:hypothetical protein
MGAQREGSEEKLLLAVLAVLAALAVVKPLWHLLHR